MIVSKYVPDAIMVFTEKKEKKKETLENIGSDGEYSWDMNGRKVFRMLPYSQEVQYSSC